MCHYNAIYSTNSSEIWQYDIVSFFNSCYLQRISYCFVFVTSHTVCIQTTYTLRGAVTFPEYVISDILMVNIGTGTFMSLAPLDVSLAPPQSEKSGYGPAIRDHPRSLCSWPQLPVKFHVNLIHKSEDIVIYICRILGLKCLLRPPKWWFWGTLNP